MTYIIKMVWQKYNMVSRGSPGPSRELSALSKIHDNSFSYKYHLYGKKVPQLVNLRCHIIFDYDLLSMLCSYNFNAYSILWLYIKVRELQCPFNFLKFFRHITLFEFWFDFYLISLMFIFFDFQSYMMYTMYKSFFTSNIFVSCYYYKQFGIFITISTK